MPHCYKAYLNEFPRKCILKIVENKFTPTTPDTTPLWNEVEFIDRVPHWYKRRVKEAIHIRLHPNNINRDNGIEIPEAWMPTIKKHNNRRREGTTGHRNSEDRNAPITAVENQPITAQQRALYKALLTLSST